MSDAEKTVKALRDFAKTALRIINDVRDGKTHPDEFPDGELQAAKWALASIADPEAGKHVVFPHNERQDGDLALNGEPLVLVPTQNDPEWWAESLVRERFPRI